MDERRKFERINLPQTAKVFADDSHGQRLGHIVVLGRGGMLVKTEIAFVPNTRHVIQLVDESEGIRREVNVVARYKLPEGTGFEFQKLEPDAAVELGVIIGKYYSTAK